MYSLVSNIHVESEVLTDYVTFYFLILSNGVVYLDQLMGARHTNTYLIMIDASSKSHNMSIHYNRQIRLFIQAHPIHQTKGL